MREAETEFERSPTAANRAALAAALSAAGRYDEAIKHYDECASGSYAKDVHFVRSLAATNLLAERWSAARAEPAERLFALGKDARQPDDDLGYAFALARLGDGSADAAFQHAVTTANGPVARCRYAQYLDESGRRREARELYEQVVKEGRLAPATHGICTKPVQAGRRCLESAVRIVTGPATNGVKAGFLSWKK